MSRPSCLWGIGCYQTYGWWLWTTCTDLGELYRNQHCGEQGTSSLYGPGEMDSIGGTLHWDWSQFVALTVDADDLLDHLWNIHDTHEFCRGITTGRSIRSVLSRFESTSIRYNANSRSNADMLTFRLQQVDPFKQSEWKSPTLHRKRKLNKSNQFLVSCR